MDAKQAHKEHVLAVSRDFISQPRLSKNILIIISFITHKGVSRQKKFIKYKII